MSRHGYAETTTTDRGCLPVEILSEPAPAETLPREIPRSELRVGDKYQSSTGACFVVADSYNGGHGLWAVRKDGRTRVELSAKASPGFVILLSRNNPVDSPSPAPEPDHSAKEATQPSVPESWPYCVACKQPFWAGRKRSTPWRCGDCTTPDDDFRFDARRFRGTEETTPASSLPPGVAYHLNDCGGFYSPSWEE